MKTSIRDRRVLARLLRTLRELTPRRPRRVFLEEAEIELWGLYRREQAELLRRAAGLRNAPTRAGSTGEVDAPNADRERRAHEQAELRRAWLADVRAWRACAAECAFVCACDGYPLAPQLAACIAHPTHAWTAAHVLAASARRLGITTVGVAPA